MYTKKIKVSSEDITAKVVWFGASFLTVTETTAYHDIWFICHKPGIHQHLLRPEIFHRVRAGLSTKAFQVLKVLKRRSCYQTEFHPRKKAIKFILNNRVCMNMQTESHQKRKGNLRLHLCLQLSTCFYQAPTTYPRKAF